MSPEDEHDPGDEAPHTVHYAVLDVFGTPTGMTVHILEGEPLPLAPRGFKWCRIIPEES
jgi:hypothetical protein